jgi:hypothetical protein
MSLRKSDKYIASLAYNGTGKVLENVEDDFREL